MNVLNLTQHAASPDQVAAGVVEPTDKVKVSKLLTFDTPPSQGDMEERARALAYVAIGQFAKSAMIGGAPFFMGTLERVLKEEGIKPLHAFSRRESVDQPQPDGSTKKVAVFRHAGWVEA